MFHDFTKKMEDILFLNLRREIFAGFTVTFHTGFICFWLILFSFFSLLFIDYLSNQWCTMFGQQLDKVKMVNN